MGSVQRRGFYRPAQATAGEAEAAKQWQEAYNDRIRSGAKPSEAALYIQALRETQDGVKSQPPLLYELVRIVEYSNQPLFIESLGELQDIGYDNRDLKELNAYCNKHGIEGYIVVGAPGYGDVIEAWPGLGELTYLAKPEKAQRANQKTSSAKHYPLPTPTNDKALAATALNGRSAAQPRQLALTGGR